MKRSLLSLLPAIALFAGGSLTTGAAEISESQAAAIAGRFMNPGHTAMSAETQSPKLECKYMTPQGATGLYLFSTGGGNGFVVVSGDDSARQPVLGYGYGDFDASQMPPAMKWWLESYAQQMQMAGAQAAPRKAVKYNDGLPDEVEPLLGFIAWDQGSPYNTLCPTINGKSCYTGCVATSTAQVMKYHAWPEQGTGEWSYKWNNGTTSQTLSVDFSQQTYNWDLMPDHYTAKSPADEDNEVAHLMYNVGVAVSMDYGTNGSGAASTATIPALLFNFKYDKGMHFCYRNLYGIELWEETIRQELAAGRPIIYGGQSNQGGHQFVLDGYDADGYFHINWGWSGMCNGYFLTTALVPDGVGAGGFAAGYDYNQSMVTGIQPDQGHDDAWNASYIGQSFTSDDGMTYNFQSYLMSFISSQQTFDVGIAFVAGDTPVVDQNMVLNGTSVTLTPTAINRSTGSLSESPFFNSSLTFDPVDALNLPDGAYSVYPVAKPASATEWSIIPMSENQSVEVTVSNGVISVDPAVSPSLSLSDLSIPDTIVLGHMYEITGTLSVVGTDFYNTVNVAVLNQSGSTVARGNSILVDIPEDGSFSFSVPLSLSTSIAPGTYTVKLIAGGQNIAQPQTVNVVSGAVELNSANFPDANFLAVVKSAFDSDGDGVLSDTELSKATTISATKKGISDVTGLSNFYNLHVLYLEGNYISEIDLSQLTNLVALDLLSNELTSIDLSNNGDLEMVILSDNLLSNVDVSECTMLSSLAIDRNPILAIDLSSTEALQSLKTGSNAAISLDEHGCYDLSAVPQMDVTKISNLQGATLEGTMLKPTAATITYDYDTGNPQFAAMPVTLMTTNVVGIDTPATEAASVTASNGAIRIAAEGPADVYDLAGRRIYSGAGNATVSAAPGAYIVRTGAETVKVVVR